MANEGSRIVQKKKQIKDVRSAQGQPMPAGVGGALEREDHHRTDPTQG